MISVIIPAYNEENMISESMQTLSEYLKNTFDSWEIVISNDGSTDKTKDILKQLECDIENLRYVSYDDNRGKGSAIREGILSSKGDIVVYTDCDLAYGTEIIKTISDKLLNDKSDIVIGSRNISSEGYKNYTFLRKLASHTYIKLISFAAKFKHTDSQCGIKCFKGDVARKVFSKCTINGFAFDLEALMIAEAMEYTITEQSAVVINHRESQSKVHLVKDTLKMLKDIKKIKAEIKELDI